MDDKDVKKLKREELLEMLIVQKKENEKLKAELDVARSRLEDKHIRIEKSGSIAEASYMLNGLFDAAQETVLQYLQNTCKERTSLPRRGTLEDPKVYLDELRDTVVHMQFRKKNLGGYDPADVEDKLEKIVRAYERCVDAQRDAYQCKIEEYEENMDILQMLVTELNHKIYHYKKEKKQRNNE